MRLALSVALAAIFSLSAQADEGMWTFDNFPKEKLQSAHGVSVSQDWLDRIQKASVRLDGGCSASVVSKDGLVLTNHHCIVDCAQNLSSETADYVGKGFKTANRAEEKQCPGAEASILQTISDVTERVKAATANVAAEDVIKKKDAEIAAIEEACGGADAKKRCEVVSLYGGGQYKLYEYRRYQDVRLAFAPEISAAFFGGDPDNFNFPRYAFDMALVRLYEDGKPANFEAPLSIDPNGADEGEVVFTSGHPGSTQRLYTVAQLEHLRDEFLPWRLMYLSEMRGTILATGRQSAETGRRLQDTLFGVENSIKALRGQREALADAAFFQKIADRENTLRTALTNDATLASTYGDPWASVEAAEKARRSVWMATELLERRAGGGSTLLWSAKQLTRAPAEAAKPAADRLPEYSPSALVSLEKNLLAPTPVYADVEEMQLTFWLLKVRENLGADHPVVAKLFGARTAEEIARDVAQNSKLGDPAVREALWKGGAASLAAANDPALKLFAAVDAEARAARERFEKEVSGPVSAASEKLAGVRFAVEGDSVYPDATFTLRLSYGVVKGWEDPQFGTVAPFTRASGLWTRATGADPFKLADAWNGKESALAPDLQFNLVSTNDIIGGNSGSPLIDKDGQIVGLVFDGNIHSLGGAYGFDEALNRTVSVASPLIVEGLRKIYGVTHLADELASTTAIAASMTVEGVASAAAADPAVEIPDAGLVYDETPITDPAVDAATETVESKDETMMEPATVPEPAALEMPAYTLSDPSVAVTSEPMIDPSTDVPATDVMPDAAAEPVDPAMSEPMMDAPATPEPMSAAPAATDEPALESEMSEGVVTEDAMAPTDPVAPEADELDALDPLAPATNAAPLAEPSSLPQPGATEATVTERVAASRVPAVDIASAMFPSIERASAETQVTVATAPEAILRKIEHFAVTPGMYKVAEVTTHPEFGTVVRGDLEMHAGAPDAAGGRNAQRTIRFSSFVGNNGEPVILFANLN